MEAIEFEATLGIDGIISIPHDIGGKVRTGPVRVIVIEAGEPVAQLEPFDESLDETRNYLRYLMENPFKVDKSVPFLTRDEIYDRNI